MSKKVWVVTGILFVGAGAGVAGYTYYMYKKGKKGQCSLNVDCPVPFSTCVKGTCLLPECSADKDCPTNKACDRGKCVARAACKNNADCPVGPNGPTVCKAGQCIVPEPECSVKDDCPSNKVCSALHQCVDCNVDGDCPLGPTGMGSKCTANKCIAPLTCAVDADCSDRSTHCDQGSGLCVAGRQKACTEVTNYADCDTTNGEMCFNGFCTLSACNGSDPSECGLSKKCVDKTCRVDHSTCTTDAECLSGSFCDTTTFKTTTGHCQANNRAPCAMDPNCRFQTFTGLMPPLEYYQNSKNYLLAPGVGSEDNAMDMCTYGGFYGYMTYGGANSGNSIMFFKTPLPPDVYIIEPTGGTEDPKKYFLNVRQPAKHGTWGPTPDMSQCGCGQIMERQCLDTTNGSCFGPSKFQCSDRDCFSYSRFDGVNIKQ